MVGELPDRGEPVALGHHRLLERDVLALQRVGSAALAEPANEHVVPGEEKHHRRREPSLLEPAVSLGKVLQKAPLAHVGGDPDAVDVVSTLRGQLAEREDELRREVVYTEEPSVLEGLHRERLPRTGQAGDEDENARWVPGSSNGPQSGSIRPKLPSGRRYNTLVRP